MSSKLARRSGPAALVVSLISLVISMSGVSLAKHSAPARRSAAGTIVRLDRTGKIPAQLVPKVKLATNAQHVGGLGASDLTEQCSAEAVDMGTYCIDSAPYAVTPSEVGKNDYFFATQKCQSLGGYLPDAGQLIGAAPRIKLNSTIDDNATDANIDMDPTDGLKDQREMSSTLITTAAGARAAGSEGVTAGSKGNPRVGEPDPVPQPANPAPDTLQYVTVYDNHDHGGFAGSEPVNKPEAFRCAFNKQQGQSAANVGGQ